MFYCESFAAQRLILQYRYVIENRKVVHSTGDYNSGKYELCNNSTTTKFYNTPIV